MIRTCLFKQEYTELTYYSEASGDMVFKCHVNKAVGLDDLKKMFDEVITATQAAEAEKKEEAND